MVQREIQVRRRRRTVPNKGRQRRRSRNRRQRRRPRSLCPRRRGDDGADDEFTFAVAAEVLWAQLGADHADESLGGADVNPKCRRRIHC